MADCHVITAHNAHLGRRREDSGLGLAEIAGEQGQRKVAWVCWRRREKGRVEMSTGHS